MVVDILIVTGTAEAGTAEAGYRAAEMVAIGNHWHSLGQSHQ